MFRSCLVASTILIIAFTLFDAQPVAAAAEPFTVAVPVLDKAPSLAGTLDDSWTKAARVPVPFDFTYQRPGEPTTAYIAQDPGGLDVAFEVTQRETLTASQTINGGGVFSDDNVTLVVSPQGTRGFQYTVHRQRARRALSVVQRKQRVRTAMDCGSAPNVLGVRRHDAHSVRRDPQRRFHDVERAIRADDDRDEQHPGLGAYGRSALAGRPRIRGNADRN